MNAEAASDRATEALKGAEPWVAPSSPRWRYGSTSTPPSTTCPGCPCRCCPIHLHELM
jgi:hypothetical protein